MASSSCEEPPIPVDGDIKTLLKQQYNNGESVEYVCARHYVIEGGTHRTCQNGQWVPVGEIRCVPARKLFFLFFKLILMRSVP